jgi:chromosome segregation ATPase
MGAYIQHQSHVIQSLTTQHENTSSRASQFEKDSQQAHKRLDELQSDLSTLDKEHKDTKTKYNTLSVDKDRLEASLTTDRKTLEEKHKQLEKTLADTTAKYDAVRAEYLNFTSDAQEQKQKFDEKNKEWIKIEEKWKMKEEVWKKSEGDWRRKEVEWQVQNKQARGQDTVKDSLQLRVENEIKKVKKSKKKTEEDKWLDGEHQKIDDEAKRNSARMKELWH